MLDADATSATICQVAFMEPTKLGPLVGSSKRNGATIELCRTFLFPDTRGAFPAFHWPKAPPPPRPPIERQALAPQAADQVTVAGDRMQRRERDAGEKARVLRVFRALRRRAQPGNGGSGGGSDR